MTPLDAQSGEEGASNPRANAEPYRAASPEYGMHLFVLGDPPAAERDLAKLNALRFGWQKSHLLWRLIEPEPGNFQWNDADQLVLASNAAGINLIARVDSPPDWARSDRANNGPPNRVEDFEAFAFTLADRYKPGSPFGAIAAFEFWNEPNLDREWGGRVIDRSAAAQYVRLLCAGNRGAKRASPDVVTISAALSPTGTTNGRAMDDVIYLGWLYDAGVRPCFDVLGAHGVGYKAPPWISPQELATNRQWGGHASFGFRRVEQLRDVMLRYGDAGKQVWLTEFGWTSDPVHQGYAWHRVSEEQKADYIVAAFQWASNHWRPWIGVMVVWNMPAPHWEQSQEEYWWSITNPDGTTRLAYDRLLLARTNGQLP